MLIDLRLKNFHLMSSYIGCEGVVIVEEYDKKSLYPMFTKCHNHLHHVLEFEVGYANPTIEEDCGLDIFEQTTNANELVKELVSREL